MQLRHAASVLASGALVAAAAVVWSAPASADATQSGQWYLAKLGVRHAWTITQGSGVKVGVVDSGVDSRAPDLVDAVGAGKDFSGQGSANGQEPVGGDQHGTNVASLLAGRGHGSGHSSGVIGTAPAATIISASLRYGPDDPSPQAIRWAVDNGARVINLSYTTTSAGQEDAVRYAESKDVVVVAATGDTAAGGQRNQIGIPAALPGVVAVTGVDETLKSDPGAAVGQGTALAAPFSTTPTDPDGGAPTKGLPVANAHGYAGGPYSQRIGTSFGVPIVAGIAALVRAKFPALDAANVINRLIKTATPEGGAVPNPTYGYGVVNAYQALTAKIPPVTANPLGALVGSAGSASPVPGSSPASSSPSSGPASSGSAPIGSASTGPAQASGSGSSGLGAGAWAGIAAVVLVAAGLIVWLLSRNRRPPPGAPPAGYPPPGYRSG